MRWSFHVLLQEHRPSAESAIYITEQFTTPYRWLRGRFPGLVGSEYLADNMPSGTIKDGIRHEDLQRLSFRDRSLDYVLSFEVFEHVPDMESLTREVFRVLRPGGRLFLTSPFHLDWEKNQTRAVMSDGVVTHLLPPEIHGNPTDPAGGSLCFRHFGWEYLDHLRDAGFHDVEVVTLWSESLGYLGEPAIVTAVRP